MIEQIKNKIHQLVQKYEHERDYYRTSRFNEMTVSANRYHYSA